ncbi:MAG: DUF4920 domain-containing protein [Chitinophagaceae bacterium]
MKRFVVALTILFIAASTASEAHKTYGKAFTVKSVQTTEQVAQKLRIVEKVPNVVVKGVITQVCQKQGCWMKLKNTGGEDMMVMMKDHKFFLPKDATSKTATIYGTAMRETTSAAELKHLAEDAGKSEKEIEAITEPKAEYKIQATGVILD